MEVTKNEFRFLANISGKLQNCKNLDNIRKTIELEKQGKIGANYIGKPVGKK